MDKKSLGFIAGAGGALLLLYFLFFRKNKSTNSSNSTNPFPTSNQPFDPYSLVDKTEKVEKIKDYLKANGQYNLNIGIEYPYWNFSYTYAKTDEGIIAWYAAIQKNEPTFTFYNKVLRINEKVNTKTGQKV